MPRPTRQNRARKERGLLNQPLSRRSFLKTGTLFITASALGGCRTRAPDEDALALPASVPEVTPLPVAEQYPEVPMTPAAPPASGVLEFFTPHEAKTLDALTARIFPGSPDDPGAHEAGVVNYIDHKLTFDDGFAQPTYMHPPFAKAYEGDTPPAEAGEDYGVVWVQKDQLERYGYQLELNPREVYRQGLSALERYTQDRYGAGFAALAAEQQDEVVGQLAEGAIDSFKKPSAKQFFKIVRDDVTEGMFCDPIYGGNRDMVGWKLLGYPGAQRAYTPAELLTEGTSRAPQGIAELHRFSPGQPANREVTLPVSGFDMQHKP